MGAMPSDCDTSHAGGSGGYGVATTRSSTSPREGQARSAGTTCRRLACWRRSTARRRPTSSSTRRASAKTAATTPRARRSPTATASSRNASRRSWRRRGTATAGRSSSPGMRARAGHLRRYGDNGGHVLTVVISASTKGDTPSARYVDSAGILRTVEHAYGLSYLGAAAQSQLGQPAARHGWSLKGDVAGDRPLLKPQRDGGDGNSRTGLGSAIMIA